MQVALRRRLRLALPLHSDRCGPSPGCGAQVDAVGDHALACPRSGLLARRAKIVERAWVRAAREAVGADGQVVPPQWLAHTTAPRVDPSDRRRLDLVIYGATPLGGALCCDATLVSPLISPGSPIGRRRHARSRLQTQASERSGEPRQRARSVRFVRRKASQKCDQGLPDCIVVQLGVGGDLGGGDGPQGMVSDG